MFFEYNVLIIMLIYFNFNSIEKGFIGTPNTCGDPFFILFKTREVWQLTDQKYKINKLRIHGCYTTTTTKS